MRYKTHIEAQPFYLWFTYIVAGALCTMGVILFVVVVFDIIPIKPPEDRILLLTFALFWNTGVLWVSYTFLKMPIEINVTDNGNITLRSLVRKTFIKPSQVTKLIDSDGDWILYHTKGKLDLRNFKYNKLKGFLEWLVLSNPSILAPDELK